MGKSSHILVNYWEGKLVEMLNYMKNVIRRLKEQTKISKKEEKEKNIKYFVLKV